MCSAGAWRVKGPVRREIKMYTNSGNAKAGQPRKVTEGKRERRDCNPAHVRDSKPIGRATGLTILININ